MPDTAAKPVHPALIAMDDEVGLKQFALNAAVSALDNARSDVELATAARDETVRLRDIVAAALAETIHTRAPRAARKPRGPNAAPDNLTAQRTIDLLSCQPSGVTEPAILDHLVRMGSKKSVAKKTLRSMVKEFDVILENGLHRLPGAHPSAPQSPAARTAQAVLDSKVLTE